MLKRLQNRAASICKGKETNGGLLSAVLLARAPRERDVRPMPHLVSDQQNVLSRDWLGRDILSMLEPVLARFHSVLLIGHLRHPRLQEDLQRAYDRKVASVEASEFGRFQKGIDSSGRARRARRHVILASRDLNLNSGCAAS